MKSLSNRRCKEIPGLLYTASTWSGVGPTVPGVRRIGINRLIYSFASAFVELR
jgi:hypothetical protein